MSDALQGGPPGGDQALRKMLASVTAIRHSARPTRDDAAFLLQHIAVIVPMNAGQCLHFAELRRSRKEKL